MEALVETAAWKAPGLARPLLLVSRSRSRALWKALEALGLKDKDVRWVEEPLEALPLVRRGSVSAVVIDPGVRRLAVLRLLREPRSPEAGVRMFLLVPEEGGFESVPPDVTPVPDGPDVGRIAQAVWLALGLELPAPPRFEPRVRLERADLWDSSRAWDRERQGLVLLALQEKENPETGQLLREAAHEALRVEHRNVPRILEIGETRGRAFQTWEDVPGVWLPRWLHRRSEAGGGPLGVESCAWIAAELADALDAVHAAGGAHGLMDEGSVGLTPEGGVRLLYLGMARASFEDRLVLRCSGRAAMLPRSAVDLPPELLLRRAATPKTDVYRLGLLLFRLLWECLPFKVKRFQFVGLYEVHTLVPAPPEGGRTDVPAELVALVLRMLERDPERRPSSAEVRDTLRALPGLGVKDLRGPPPELVEGLRPRE
jgi:serine/threonine protein kinase